MMYIHPLILFSFPAYSCVFQVSFVSVGFDVCCVRFGVLHTAGAIS